MALVGKRELRLGKEVGELRRVVEAMNVSAAAAGPAVAGLQFAPIGFGSEPVRAPGYTGPLPSGIPTGANPFAIPQIPSLPGIPGGVTDAINFLTPFLNPLINPGACSPPLVQDQAGGCVFPGSPGDISTNGAVSGVAVMGRYGAAESPATRTAVRRKCPRGTVLGKDNLCYDGLRRGERKWPPGRKPLLTGGDLNAISKASRAASRIETKTKQLQRLGMLRKPHTHRKKAT